MPLLTRPSSSSSVPSSALRRASAGAAPLLTAALTPLRLAQARTGLGVAMLLRPTLLSRTMGVDSAAATRTAWTVQMVGAREVALGVGAWAALRRPDARAARLWLVAGLITDATDALVVAGAVGRGRVRGPAGAAGVLTATTAVGVQAAALARR